MARDGAMSIVVIPDGLRRPLRWAGFSLLAAALLAAGATAVEVLPDRVASAAPSAPTALLVSGSSLSYAQAQQTAAHLQWDAGVYALPGAGLSRSTLEGGDSISTITARLLPSADGSPDVVVVQGGEADHASSPVVLRRATEQLLDRLRTATGGQTQLVLVGPIPGATVPPSLVMVNRVLTQVTQERGVPYVDPIALGWRAGDPAVPAALAGELAALVENR